MIEGIKTYKTQDLVLQVRPNYDPTKLNLKNWGDFIDVLCEGREYQKDAIRDALIFIASGEYRSIEDLVNENFKKNDELQKRYRDIREYESKLPLPHKLAAVIDLATGTGKSYVIYGIAQIALGIGLVDKVLVLCPSRTIESGLKEKFENLSGNNNLKESLPRDAIFKNPRIIDANHTIKDGDICVENIHAVYEKTGSSINDSLKGKGERVLVLNDEVHHAYNSTNEADMRKWKTFLLNPNFNFKYILGFTGTAYIDDEYFNDVIYRYSIRQAIDERVIKSVEYVAKDESKSNSEKFQKIYDNQREFIRNYPRIKPLTIFVTKDIGKAGNLREEFMDFLMMKEKLSRKQTEKKVSIVTSHKDHRKNILELKKVDDKESPVEWIISVSMLTEGWDVKNVFQIVPWEDRAFNSKLLIAQVLGRGLRLPEEYKSPQPKVRVFNHDAWSKSIDALVDEILEVETRIVSESLRSGNRAKYHFDLYRIDYDKKEVERASTGKTKRYDYFKKGYIDLVAQTEEDEKTTEYQDLSGGYFTKKTVIQKQLYTINEVVEKITETFKVRDFEAKIRFLGKEYSKEHLPPEGEIRKIIEASMKKRGIKSDHLTEDNAMRVQQAFGTFFRKRATFVDLQRLNGTPKVVSTKQIEKESMSIGAVKHGRGSAIFYSDEFENECSKEQAVILKEIIDENKKLGRGDQYAIVEVNKYQFKTPVSLIFTNKTPEEKFVEYLIGQKLSEKLDAWVKSRDVGFYSIEYSWRKGEHPIYNSFNPDFFLKCGNNIVVIEVKSDGDDSEENRAKYEWAREYFADLNEELKKTKIKQKYFFHFLSPDSYLEFVEYLSDGRLLNGKFRSNLEDLLEKQ
jgi:type III restriction enzyme